MYRISHVSEQGLGDMLTGAGISIFHSNTYFLTGVIPTDHERHYRRGDNQLRLTGIADLIPWIRGIVNQYVRKQYVSLYYVLI